jgi:hypothetical protein
MKPYDHTENPFIELDLCKDELVEAYALFADADPEAQHLIVEALDRKYSVEELWATF